MSDKLNNSNPLPLSTYDEYYRSFRLGKIHLQNGINHSLVSNVQSNHSSTVDLGTLYRTIGGCSNDFGLLEEQIIGIYFFRAHKNGHAKEEHSKWYPSGLMSFLHIGDDHEKKHLPYSKFLILSQDNSLHIEHKFAPLQAKVRSGGRTNEFTIMERGIHTYNVTPDEISGLEENILNGLKNGVCLFHNQRKIEHSNMDIDFLYANNDRVQWYFENDILNAKILKPKEHKVLHKELIHN